MASTRYTRSRTLVRRLRRFEQDSRDEFKAKVLRLRRQFEQFNVDVSEICQWVMPLRPGAKKASEATTAFWEFFLEPEKLLPGEDEDESDRCRRAVFEVAAGMEAESTLASAGLTDSLMDSVRAIRGIPPTPTATRLFERLSRLDRSHRQVLLKAAADWIVARYLRGYRNWQRRQEEWETEKAEWEKDHPALTESVRADFNRIFADLDIERKRPRVCEWERLKARKDDCQWAGERIRLRRSWQNHSSLCVKYREFRKDYPKDSRVRANFKNYFVENANEYLGLRRNGLRAGEAMGRFLRRHSQARWFRDAWRAYLAALDITEETAMKAGGGLPHCTKFQDDLDCQFNVHTEKCLEYRRCLEGRPDLQPLEGLYRQWRAEYLRAPAKPCFQYPSPRKLPMPKIFGRGYFRVDLATSLLELRLEGAGEGQFERFRFAAWPTEYEPTAQVAEITSVHINFVGTRARVGFHFKVRHKESRFAMSQDEIDELRSRKYPRQAQDGRFLAEARKRLLDSFEGDAERELRILAVDLGTGGAYAVVFEGRCFKEAEPLKIVKIDELRDAWPKRDGEDRSEQEQDKAKRRGLGPRHVGGHLESWAAGAARIAQKRGGQDEGAEPATLGDHDMRRLALHVRGMLRDWVRLNTSRIIEVAEGHQVDLIVVESMRGFRLPGYDKVDPDKKRRLAFFSHGRIRHKLREKAVERGMRVVTVPYLFSSQVCAKCGKQQEDKKKWLENKKAHLFACEDCGPSGNSDENAARVLAKVFWGEITLPTKSEDGA